jgi:hypothetical protein
MLSQDHSPTFVLKYHNKIFAVEHTEITIYTLIDLYIVCRLLAEKIGCHINEIKVEFPSTF